MTTDAAAADPDGDAAELIERARVHHLEAQRCAAFHRAERDRAVRAVRAADPELWTHTRIAEAAGMVFSKELVGHILAGDDETARPSK